MAKKVVNQVVIKDEELTPTTLGVYSNKGKSPIGLILIILIFLALLIFLPNIETYYNKITGKDNEPTFTTDEEITDDDDNTRPLEFPDYVCYEIVNELVKLLMENASDPRLQTNYAVNQTVADPTAPQPQSQSSRDKS